MRELGFWEFLARAVYQAAGDTARFFGWDIKTAATGIGLLVVGFAIHWWVRGLAATKEEISKFVIITVAPLILFMAGLLIYEFFKAPYVVYRQEIAEAVKVIRATDDRRAVAEKESSTRQATSEDLRRQLAAKAKEVKIAGGVAGNPNSDEEERKQKLKIRTVLGNLLAKATEIKTACLSKAPNFSCEQGINQWAENTRKYLSDNLEPSYLARFDAANGPYLSYNAVAYNEKINNLVNYITNRIAILEKFIEEYR